ncbi:MAG: transporter substrate-binding domain-containing protein [Spirochaetaceae bacterium]|nr:transporter substrate-binding domain-containing protein [Spirochaetaceae bacterium]
MKKSIAIIFTLMMIASVFAGGAKEKIVINTADDLVGKKIGVQAGTTGELYVQENVKDAKIASFKTGMDAALDLKNGAIDAIVLDELPAKEIVARNPSLMIVDLDLATEAYAIAVKKGNAELLASINKTIADMKANGDYEALVNAFMPVDGNITIPDTVTINTDKVVKLGTNAAFPPFEYVDGKNIVGFDISMGQKIAAGYGAKLEVVDMAFDSLIPALASDAIDFIAAGMSVTEERKKNVDFSDPYYESKQVVIIRK